MKIFIIGACGFADGYFAGGRYFIETFAFDVGFYPLLTHNRLNYPSSNIISCLNGTLTDETLPGSVVNQTPTIKADICIWWWSNIPLPNDQLEKICVSTTCRHILFDWDPGDHGDMSHSLLDICYCCSPVKVQYLRSKNIKAQYLLVGYSPYTSYPCAMESSDYSCDVSIVMTTTYSSVEDRNTFPNQPVPRQELVDRIYADKSINFHIYGLENFRELYPRAYRGFISYSDCYKVFSNSKINLNISPVGDSLNFIIDGEKKVYYSERMPQILACQGLACCDTDLEPLIPKDAYIHVLSVDDAMEKIYSVLNSSEKYDVVREKGYMIAQERLSWKDTINDIVHQLIN